MHFVQLPASGLKHALSRREGGLQGRVQGRGWAQSVASCLQTPGYLHKVVEVSEILGVLSLHEISWRHAL